ncbi:MAG TPA: histidine--tRNA ligase [Microbacteriaceae bacterium]|nr:histidine--tRNA ligase [Microbacteriaceae bacterium]
MADAVQPPRGMRDFLPAEKAHRENVLAVIRGVYQAHGFSWIETPVVEDVRRLHSGLGGDNEKLGFSVLRRGLDTDDLRRAADGGDPLLLADLGLRFDLTVPLARFYASHRAVLPSVFRSLQIAPVWRAERPQRGRFRQFTQCDIDVIGEPGPLAEAELMTATSAALGALGLTGCTIRVNDRRILDALLEHCGFAADRRAMTLVSLDKLDKIGAEGVLAELGAHDPEPARRLGAVLSGLEERLRAGIPLTAAAIGEVLPATVAPGVAAELDALARVVAPVAANVRLVFDPTLVRGMGYYTGTIFEISHPASGSSIGGGGRYDEMIGRFAGVAVPACGFSIGFERVVDLVARKARGGDTATVLVYEREVPHADLMRLKTALVAGGDRVRLARRTKNLKGLLGKAAEDGYTTFALVDRETAGRGAAALETRPLA